MRVDAQKPGVGFEGVVAVGCTGTGAGLVEAGSLAA
jgi:hypothetical protein